jgi:hypothetical protein
MLAQLGDWRERLNFNPTNQTNQTNQGSAVKER